MQSVTVKCVCVFRAVSDSPQPTGTLRLLQGMTDETTRITGTIKGLAPSTVFELRATLFGDLSDLSFKAIGGPFETLPSRDAHFITSDQTGISKVDLTSSLKLIGPLSIIGRCLAIVANAGGPDEKIIAASVVGIAAVSRDGHLSLN